MVTSLFPEKFRTIDKSRSRFFLIKILTAGAIFCAVVYAGVAYSRSRKAIERAKTAPSSSATTRDTSSLNTFKRPARAS